MYSYIDQTTSGTRIVISNSPPPVAPELVLSPDEADAIERIVSILSIGGVDISTISPERVKDYLKLSARIKLQYSHILTFCHLKLGGRSRYMELTINSQHAKQFATDPRFSNVRFSQKRFTRIPIEGSTDVALYGDAILKAYEWGTTVIEHV